MVLENFNEEITIPDSLMAYLTESHGPAGIEWLNSIKGSVKRLAKSWCLKNFKTHPLANRSLLLICEDDDGFKRALKLEFKWGVSNEALNSFNKINAGPEIIDVNPNFNATLMNWVEGYSPEAGDGSNVNLTFNLVEVLTQVNKMDAPDGTPQSGNEAARWAEVAAGRLNKFSEKPYDLNLLKEDTIFFEGLKGGLLHGDLTPGNIIVKNGNIKLIDPEPISGPVERDVANWCHRSQYGKNINAYINAAMKANSSMDRELLGRFICFGARTYTAYALTFNKNLSKEYLKLANMKSV